MSLDTNLEDDFQPRLNWDLWRKILLFTRPYRRHFAGLFVVAVLTAACDVLIPLLAGWVIDEVTQHGGEVNLARFGIAFGIVVVVFAMCVLAFITLAGLISTGVSYDIRKACFDKLQELSFSYYDRRPVGWLMARLTSDCQGLARIIGWSLLDAVWGMCFLSGIMGVMFWLNWKLALIVLSIVPPLVVISRYFQLRLLISSRAVRKANSHVTAGFNEGIMGVRTSKSLVRERRNLKEFQSLSTQMYDHSVTNALHASVFLPCVLTLCSVGVGLALWFGGAGAIAGTVTVGTLVIFINYATQFANPIEELARTITMIQGAQASAERIQQLLDTEPQVRDSGEVLAAIKRQEHVVAGRDVAIDGLPDRIQQVEFRHTSFAYKKGQKVLNDFNLKVARGQTIALVGPTGGGKSTIVSLLCRFYEPTEGQILINGTDYRQRSLHWLQSSLGIVLQVPHLFSGTIRQNIRYGDLGASDEQVERAARLVNADGFIAQLADGFDAQVGEGGNQLSTGQKQLIALARAILADPQIFIMDEATSSVDTEAEQQIQEGIDRVLTGRMAFVIAHRLSTIQAADRILVVCDGQVTEDGNHDQLIALRGHYYQLYTNQFSQDQSSQLLAGAAKE